MLDVAGLPRSTYYYYTRKQKDPDKYAELKEEIRSIVTEHKGRYGYSFGILVINSSLRSALEAKAFLPASSTDIAGAFPAQKQKGTPQKSILQRAFF